MMEVETTSIPGVLIFTPARFTDSRGVFSEVFSAQVFAVTVPNTAFVQDNQSISTFRGTLRGLHFQTEPFRQAKLVRVIRGRILDVAVDLRHGSATFGWHVAVELSAENWRQLWIPEGLAHGFVTLEPQTEVLYKVTAPYSADNEYGIAFDDPHLRIDWRIGRADAILSDRDRNLPLMADLGHVQA